MRIAVAETTTTQFGPRQGRSWQFGIKLLSAHTQGQDVSGEFSQAGGLTCSHQHDALSIRSSWPWRTTYATPVRLASGEGMESLVLCDKGKPSIKELAMSFSTNSRSQQFRALLESGETDNQLRNFGLWFTSC